MKIVPITFKKANEFIEKNHRHHWPSIGYKFCVAVENQGKIVGVATIGRPISRRLDDGFTVEVNRSCTDGTKNANSMLYAAASRVARELGYRKILTYTLPSESKSSLKAIGWKPSISIGGKWIYSYQPERANDWPLTEKIRWECILNGGI